MRYEYSKYIKKGIASKNDIGFEDQETEHNVLLSDTTIKTLSDFGITFQGQYDAMPP